MATGSALSGFEKKKRTMTHKGKRRSRRRKRRRKRRKRRRRRRRRKGNNNNEKDAFFVACWIHSRHLCSLSLSLPPSVLLPGTAPAASRALWPWIAVCSWCSSFHSTRKAPSSSRRELLLDTHERMPAMAAAPAFLQRRHVTKNKEKKKRRKNEG